jgi:hypothetical protein
MFINLLLSPKQKKVNEKPHQVTLPKVGRGHFALSREILWEIFPSGDSYKSFPLPLQLKKCFVLQIEMGRLKVT